MRIMGRCLHYLSLRLLLVALASPASLVSAAPQKTWTLHHAVLSENHSEPQFIPRGKLILSIRDASEEKDKKKDTEGPLHAVLENEENALSSNMVEQLLTPGAWYQLKLVDDANDKHQVITTVPACHVRRSNFRDELAVSLGSASAQILSMSYMPLISPLAPATCDAYSKDEDASKQFRFESRVSIETAVPGMTLRTVLPDYQPPPGLHMLSSKQSLKDAGGDGSQQQQQQQEPVDNTPFGFVKRYWYILLPLFIAQFISAEPPPGQQQQQGGQQQQQQQPPPLGDGAGQQAPAAAASSGEGGSARRRGKRGKT